MTTTAQTIEMTYVVKGGAAHAELARLQAQEDKLGAASGAAARGLAQLEQGMGRVGTSAAAASRDMGRLDGSLSRSIGTLKGVQDGMGKSAGALAALSGAFGHGESKAAKFGQAAVGLAGAFAAGGPVLAAFTAATFAGEALYGVYREGEANSRVFRESVDAIGPTMHRLVTDSLEPGRVAVKSLLQELRDFGKDSRQIAIDNAQSSVAMLEAGQARLERAIYKARKRLEDAQLRGIGDVEAAGAIVRTLEARISSLPGEISDAKTQVESLTDAALRLDAAEANRDRRKAAEAAGSAEAKAAKGNTLADWQGAAAARARAEFRVQRDAAQKGLEAAIDDANKRDAALEAMNDRVLDNEVKAYQFAEDYKTRIAKEAADARAAIAQGEAQAVAGYVMQGASIVAGASQQLVTDLITGQEHAAERFGIAIMQQAGQALVSYGVQAVGRGVLEASSIVTAPLAPASFAAGAALIGSGVALGGVAAGIGASLGSGSSGSGSSGASTERGTSTPRMSSAGSGAPTTTVVNLRYGGPMGRVAEDTARDIVKLQRTNGRRGR